MNFLLATVPAWMSRTFPIFERICLVLLALLALILVVLVFMQITGGSNTNNVITGNQDSYYAQNKGSSRDGKLKLTTIIMASIAVFCIILYFITEIINRAE